MLLISALQGLFSFLLGFLGHISEKSPPSFPLLPNPLTASIQTKRHPQNSNPEPLLKWSTHEKSFPNFRPHFRSSLCCSSQGTLGKSTWKAKDAPAVPHLCFGGKSTSPTWKMRGNLQLEADSKGFNRPSFILLKKLYFYSKGPKPNNPDRALGTFCVCHHHINQTAPRKSKPEEFSKLMDPNFLFLWWITRAASQNWAPRTAPTNNSQTSFIQTIKNSDPWGQTQQFSTGNHWWKNPMVQILELPQPRCFPTGILFSLLLPGIDVHR